MSLVFRVDDFLGFKHENLLATSGILEQTLRGENTKAY